MSDTAVSSAPRLAAAVPSDATVAPRPRREIDLYAEGNSFAEPEDTDTQIKALFGNDGFDFKDLLDIVNPLQHLPVVGTLYRALTGDALAPGPRILGGTLFGGIGGFVASLANAVMENETGSDLGDKALALFRGDGAPGPALAQTAPPAASLAAAAVETVQPEPGQIQSQLPDRKTLPIFAGPPATPAKTAAAPAVPASDTENPTEALIRARAAVPVSHRARSAGLPPGAAYSPARTLRPQPSLALASAAQAAPAAKPPAAAESMDASATPAAPAPDVAVMMRDALNKYEALMKGRSGHSISSEF